VALRSTTLLGIGIIAVTFLPTLSHPQDRPGVDPKLLRPELRAIARNLSELPLSFETNQGQTETPVKFLYRGAGFAAFFQRNEADLYLSPRPAPEPPEWNESSGGASFHELLRMCLIGARQDSVISGEQPLPGTVNYLFGNDPAKWHTNVSTFARVKYTSVYAGTDLVYYGSAGRLEFDFRLAPGADPSRIRIQFEGASRLMLDGDDNLVILTPGDQVQFHKPEIYQLSSEGKRRLVRGRFVISHRNIVSFFVDGYDHTRPLIIDPILNYSTYIGGPLAEATAVAVDQSGEAYVTGWANLDFPTTAGSFQPKPVTTTAANGYPAGGRIFVAKLNSSGTALLYSTYLTGSGLDYSHGIALNSQGDAFVVGSTSSQDFPVTSGAFQTKNRASNSAGFISVLNSAGSGLVYSTYLSGSTSTSVNRVAVDASGNAYLTGTTQDTDFPTTSGAFQSKPATKAETGSNSAFVAKLNPSGTGLVYSTYLSGNQADSSQALAVNSTGETYVGGNTTSTNFPTTSGALQRSTESTNKQAGFITSLNATGSALRYSTYLSGQNADAMTAIAVDSAGAVYAAGYTDSPNFPVTAGAYQQNIGYNGLGYPQTNAFVTKLNSAGTALDYSTFLGGNSGLYSADQGDGANSIQIDSQGNAIVSGTACTTDFPITLGAFEPQNLAMETSDECSSFLTKLNPTANVPLVYSTYLGGTGNQTPYGGDLTSSAVMDSSGNVYLVGATPSADFPITAGVYETPFGSNFTSSEAFITEFNGGELQKLPIPTVALTSSKNSVEFGQPVTFTAKVQSQNGASTPTGVVGFNFLQVEESDANGSGVGMGPWTTLPVDATGTATFTTSSLQGLQTPVEAHYLGDANNAPATATMTQMVAYLTTATTISASENPAPYGSDVVFTATVLDQNGNPAKGLVFMGMGNISYVETDLDANGKATWTNGQGGPPLPVGTDTVYTTYFGDTGYQKSGATLAVTFLALGTTPSPTFTPPAGTYSSVQQIALSDPNSAAAIYYTIDGSTPTISSRQYLAPITVSQTETIQAVAIASGYSASAIASATYTIPPTFALSSSASTLTINPGSQGNLTLTVTPQNGFNATVTFACSGLPTGTTCSFNPSSVTPSGSAAVTTQLTIAASASASAARPARNPFLPAAGLALAGCLLAFTRRRVLGLFLVPLAAIVLFGTLSACGGGGSVSTGGGGGGGGGGGPQPTTTTVTVTATSGSIQQSTQITLTVN
jgi:hypothetical protein